MHGPFFWRGRCPNSMLTVNKVHWLFSSFWEGGGGCPLCPHATDTRTHAFRRDLRLMLEARKSCCLTDKNKTNQQKKNRTFVCLGCFFELQSFSVDWHYRHPLSLEYLQHQNLLYTGPRGDVARLLLLSSAWSLSQLCCTLHGTQSPWPCVTSVTVALSGALSLGLLEGCVTFVAPCDLWHTAVQGAE